MSPFEVWRSWGLDPHPADAYFIALDGERALGYGYLELDGEQWRNGFLAIARARAATASHERSRTRSSSGRKHTACGRCARPPSSG